MNPADPRQRKARFALTREQRLAWDLYLAAFARLGVTEAVRQADMALDARNKRFGGGAP